VGGSPVAILRGAERRGLRTSGRAPLVLAQAQRSAPRLPAPEAALRVQPRESLGGRGGVACRRVPAPSNRWPVGRGRGEGAAPSARAARCGVRGGGACGCGGTLPSGVRGAPGSHVPQWLPLLRLFAPVERRQRERPSAGPSRGRLLRPHTPPLVAAAALLLLAAAPRPPPPLALRPPRPLGLAVPASGSSRLPVPAPRPPGLTVSDPRPPGLAIPSAGSSWLPVPAARPSRLPVATAEPATLPTWPGWLPRQHSRRVPRRLRPGRPRRPSRRRRRQSGNPTLRPCCPHVPSPRALRPESECPSLPRSLTVLGASFTQ
jgi:hypothetical protein